MKVLFLDLDTLRPDHLGCYGYHRNTSPNIDKIASQGVRFNEYYVSDAPCLPARAALTSGAFGIHNGAVNHGGTHADMRIEGATRGFRDAVNFGSLFNVFRAAGMHTCSISPFAERHTSNWFLNGLNEMHNHTGGGGMESAEHVTPVVMDWLEANKDRENWMLHINYWDPHTPYRAPADFENPFKDEPIPEWLTEETLEHHKSLAGPHTARDNGMYTGEENPDWPRMVNDIKDMNRLRDCIDGYDCGIRYMDDHIGSILDKLEAMGILDETMIIVTSDHGENFGELGMYSEHGTADRITCRIPMIIKWPGGKQGHADDGLHYSVDLLPTLKELFQNEGPNPDHWDGESYATSITDGNDTGRESLVLSQCAHVCQRSVRWGDWLYMRTYHDGLHPHFEDEMLFNLKEDPHETTNLAAEKPELVKEGAARLLAWHDEQMRTMPWGYTQDPMDVILKETGPFHARIAKNEHVVEEYRKYFNRLRETGRGDWIDSIVERHPEMAAAV
ncbi:MAG: sulfatase family protein [Planctomycetota bacterium]|jgi:arylsulfatase A-like enzyme